MNKSQEKEQAKNMQQAFIGREKQYPRDTTIKTNTN